MTHSDIWPNIRICATQFVYMCDLRHPHTSIRATWLIHTHAYVRHDSTICVACLSKKRDMTYSSVRQDSFTCVKQLIHLRNIIRSCVGYDIHDSCHTYKWVMSGALHGSCGIRPPHLWNMTHAMPLTWLIRMCDMNHVCVPRLIIHMCDKLHSFVGRDPITHATWLIHKMTWLVTNVPYKSTIANRIGANDAT